VEHMYDPYSYRHYPTYLNCTCVHAIATVADADACDVWSSRRGDGRDCHAVNVTGVHRIDAAAARRTRPRYSAPNARVAKVNATFDAAVAVLNRSLSFIVQRRTNRV
jgi:hypothetical protein